MASAAAQSITLDNFNTPGATGDVITTPIATSWVSNVTRGATTITVGGTARNDSGWGASGQLINATGMKNVEVTARRDAGNLATSLVVTLFDSNLKFHAVSVSTSEFPTDSFRAVKISLGAWPGDFDFAHITVWTIGGEMPPTGAVAFRMTFDHLALTNDTTPATPLITTQPADRVIGIGTGTTFSVVASGGDLAYQWKKGTAPITGATQSTLAIADATLASAGSYQVDVTNAVGTTPSRSALLTVLDVRPTQAFTSGSPAYVPGSTISISNTLSYASTANGLHWQMVLPTNWTYASSAGTEGASALDTTHPGLIDVAWTSVPAPPFTFTVTLNVPAGTTGDKTLAALVSFTQGGATADILARPDPLLLRNALARHAADTDADLRISLTELTRVIELYNTRNNTVRTGAYAVATSPSEDGFSPAPARAGDATLARYHSADVDHDARIGLSELLRVIQLYNYRDGSIRTGQYHVDLTGEDGFASGP